jgi:hypothetical protein
MLSLTFRLGRIAEEEEGALMFPTALPGLADDRGISLYSQPESY